MMPENKPISNIDIEGRNFEINEIKCELKCLCSCMCMCMCDKHTNSGFCKSDDKLPISFGRILRDENC